MSEPRQQWLTSLLAERSRRRGHAADNDAAREWLMQELDEMARRVRADPNFVEPTAEQRRRGLEELEDWLRERGRTQG